MSANIVISRRKVVFLWEINVNLRFMIQSMTGFGKAQVALTGRTIQIEVRTLNSKALDFSGRIASSLREIEMDMRSMAGKRIGRGKVDFSVRVEQDNVQSVSQINKDMAKAYLQQFRDFAGETDLGLSGDQLIEQVMRMPDVMERQQDVELTDEDKKAILEGVHEAMNQLDAFRKQEGAALGNRFADNIKNIGDLLKKIDAFEQERVDKIRTRIMEQLEKLTVDYDANRLEQEMIYYIEKLDVNEEKQRLAHHLSYFLETMEIEEGQVGKKLGFIAQEIGREINTLGSKSNQADMQRIVVQMKDELEQIKEQVLNVL